ncbi:hypothetical protein [Litoribrevibacter albus]|uniref:Uncharacterized protein n=1 Tax=Litoribrevibacter albus TaxID=1473156 RepID=A0AA37S7Y1_9GAMM|nr:hypothetical protein [Litoribrevibacter albus]GLQ29613.1 hypothetical protein GCM10007876_00910 [Litoribrevibacter albus]
MTTTKPEPGSPEFEACLNQQAQKWSKELFDKEKPDDIAELEKGIIAGPKNFKDVMPEKTIPEDIAIDRKDKS